jgi:hypothetical protein
MPQNAVVLADLRTNRPLQAVAAVLFLVGAALAWYLGSPLFLTTTVVEKGAVATGGTVVARGDLQRIDDLHKGTGPVQIVELDGKRFLRFADVAIQNGPDLHVYLGRGTGGQYDEARDLYLGSLKATNGTFTYELPASARLADYRSVVVWCRNFRVLFTWADLEAS